MEMGNGHLPTADVINLEMGNGRPPRRASWIWRGGVTSACGRCDRFGEGGQDACRGGRYGLCEGEKKSGSRNRKAESRNLKAERRKQREESREKKEESREKRGILKCKNSKGSTYCSA